METGKIALIVSVIVVALAVLGFTIYRASSASSGTVQSGPEQHVTAAARHGRGRAAPQPNPGQ